MKRIRTLLLFLVVLGSERLLIGQEAVAPEQHSFTISGAPTWTDTGLDLGAGDVLTLSAETKSGADANCHPQGVASNSADTSKLPLSSAAPGALIAKTSEQGAPQLVGVSSELKSEAAGHLFLGFNQAEKSDCVFLVKVSTASGPNTASGGHANLKQQLSSAAQVWLKGQFGSSASGTNTSGSNAVASGESASAPSANSAGLKLPAVILDAGLRQNIDGLPRRVHDAHGNAGDMVNFVIVGSQEKVQAALTAADWHVADVDSKEAGLKAIMNTYEKKDYLEMPMSHLYLWDRTQDFGYEQAQAFSVVASRHHFRLWKAPFTWNNEVVWVGAATHDVGFEKDIRTGKLTHKIDPNVDDERSNLAQGLEKSGKTKDLTYYLPPNSVQDAKNASGGGYHSDGRLLVVFLK